MINGDINEFINHIYYGDELIFIYKHKKFFLQGFKTDGKYTLYLDRWQPPSEDYILVEIGDNKNYPVDEFLNAKIWDDKNFWEIEKEVEWVDD